MKALRTCKCCGLEAHKEEELVLFRKHTGMKYNRTNWCYSCYNSKWKESKKKWNLKSNYGISLKEYNKLYDEQEGCCLGCGS